MIIIRLLLPKSLRISNIITLVLCAFLFAACAPQVETEPARETVELPTPEPEPTTQLPVDYTIEFKGLYRCPQNGGYTAAILAFTNTGEKPLGEKFTHIIDLTLNETLYGPYSNKNYDLEPGKCGAGPAAWLEPGETLFGTYAIDRNIHGSMTLGHDIEVATKICTSKPEYLCEERSFIFQLPQKFSF